MLNIIMPMAGEGRRFAEAGYKSPKPLVPVCGVPMAKVAIDCVRPPFPHRFTFVVRGGCDGELTALLEEVSPGCRIVSLPERTDGAARTVNHATGNVSEWDEPLLIANCDQWVDPDSVESFVVFASDVCGVMDAMTLTFDCPDRDPKWSYVVRETSPVVGSKSRRVKLVAEKEPVSTEANVGLYYFGSARLFNACFRAMVDYKETVNGEYYVAPVLNHVSGVGSVFANKLRRGRFRGLGTPEDVAAFEAYPPEEFKP